MFDYLPNNNGIDVFCKHLRSAATGLEIDDASLSFTIYDSDDQPVTGAEDVAMPYVGNPNTDPGHYRGTTTSLSLTNGARYRIVVTASDYPLTWQQYFFARPRPFSL